MAFYSLKNTMLTVACITASLHSGVSLQAMSAANASFSEKGLSGLMIAEQNEARNVLKDGAPVVSWITAGDGKPISQKLLSTRFDPTSKTLSVEYSWGKMTYVYEPVSQGIRIRVKAENSGDQVISSLRISLLTLQSLGEGKAPSQTVAVEAPPFTFFEGTQGTVILGAEEPPCPLTMDFAVDAKTDVITARMGFGGGKVVVDGVQLTETLAPGASMDFRFVIRTARAGTSAMSVAVDFLDAFRKEHPALLKWSDRRPILRAFFGGGLPKEQAVANLKSPESVMPPAPDEKFREVTMKKIDGLIEASKSVDAQGVVLWDLEGATFPHATTYIGDPRLVRLLNPQMDLLADEIMKKIHDAGVKSGVTLRPSRVVFDEKNNSAKHSYADAGDAFSELDAKVAYCKQRWGTSIFYVDTNFFWRPYGAEKKWQSGPISESVWRKLVAKYPDTLFIPEFTATADYASVAGYGEADMGDYGMPATAKALYPEAFRVIVIEDADPSDNFDRFVKGLRERNSLMTYGQSATGANVVMIQRMKDYLAMENAVKAPVKASGLIAQLSAADAQERFSAAVALAQKPDPSAADALMARVAANDEVWSVRRAALVALGKRPAAQAVPLLFELLENRELGLYGDASKALVLQDEKVDAIALEKIQTVPAGKQRPVVFEQIGDLLVRRKASHCAKDLQAVYGSLGESEKWNKKLLIGIIGQLKNPESDAFLLPLLSDPDFGPFAATALVRIGSADSISKVKDAAGAAKQSGQKELAEAFGRALQAK